MLKWSNSSLVQVSVTSCLYCSGKKSNCPFLIGAALSKHFHSALSQVDVGKIFNEFFETFHVPPIPFTPDRRYECFVAIPCRNLGSRGQLHLFFQPATLCRGKVARLTMAGRGEP